jgi:hypothetical protein
MIYSKYLMGWVFSTSLIYQIYTIVDCKRRLIFVFFNIITFLRFNVQ